MGVLFKLCQQLVKLVCGFSFSLSNESFHLACLLIEDVSSTLIVETWIEWLVVHRLIGCETHILGDTLFMWLDHFCWVTGYLLICWLVIYHGFFLILTFPWGYFLNNLSILRPQRGTRLGWLIAGRRVTNLLLGNSNLGFGLLFLNHLI